MPRCFPTSFQMTGPPVLLPSVSSHPCPETESESLLGKRAVIVEDEGITLLQLSKLLRSEGVKVVGAATNGQEGTDLVLKRRPDSVLMESECPSWMV